MQLTRSLGLAGALILSAVIGGTLIGSALATDERDKADATSRGTAYCDVFMDALASELGTDREGLTAAGRAAALAALDAAVAAGDVDADRADAVRERIEAADGDGCAWFGRGWSVARGFGHGAAHGFLRGDALDAAADALGIESSDLIGRLRDAGSLEALAEDLGASYDEVRGAILSDVRADLDAAVAEGLDQERADAAIERLEAWLDDGGSVGELRAFGPNRHHRFSPWDRHDDTDDEGS